MKLLQEIDIDVNTDPLIRKELTKTFTEINNSNAAGNDILTTRILMIEVNVTVLILMPLNDRT